MSISTDGSLFRFLVTDQRPTTLALGKNLRLFYKNFPHVTCFAHGVHLLYDTTREKHDIVNPLVADMKSVMSHSRKRKELYRKFTNDEPLPPSQ